MERKFFVSKLIYAYLFLLLYVLVIFIPSVFYSIIEYDTFDMLFNNIHINSGLTLKNIKWAFSFFDKTFWLPLRDISHMLVFYLYGSNYIGHKFSNIFIHTCNTLLLFSIFNKITTDYKLSFLIALLFGIHPMQVESVVWIMGRKDLLSTFFGFLSIRFFLLQNKKLILKNIISPLLYFFALLTKPTCWITLPFLLWLIELFKEKNFSLKNILTLLYRKYIYLIISFFIVGLNLMLSSGSDNINHILFYIKLFNAIIHYFKYIVKTFFPFKLLIFYPYNFSIDYYELTLALFVLSALIYLSFKIFNNHRILFFGLFWFLILHLPTIGLIQAGSQSIANRYNYVPIIGLIMIFSYFFIFVTNKLKNKKIIYLSYVLLISFLSLKTVYERRIWKNSYTLWKYTINNVDCGYEKTTKEFILWNYTVTLFHAKKYQELIDYFIKYNPQIVENNIPYYFIILSKSAARVGNYELFDRFFHEMLRTNIGPSNEKFLNEEQCNNYRVFLNSIPFNDKNKFINLFNQMISIDS